MLWISAVFYIFSERVIGIITKDFNNIRKLLTTVRLGEKEEDVMNSRLLETDSIVHEIQNIGMI